MCPAVCSGSVRHGTASRRRLKINFIFSSHYFGNRSLTCTCSAQSAAPLGFSASQNTWAFKSTGCLPNLTNRPTPPPKGTVNRSLLSDFQFAVIVGVDEMYQPLLKL